MAVVDNDKVGYTPGLENRNQFLIALLIAKNAPTSRSDAWSFIKKLIAMDGRYRDVFRIAGHFIETQFMKRTRAYRFYDTETMFREYNSGAVLRPFVEEETMLAEFSGK